jgi:hypothetical protein
MGLSAVQRKEQARILCIREYGIDPEALRKDVEAESRLSERRRMADWLDSVWPGDTPEERYHRLWIAVILRLES